MEIAVVATAVAVAAAAAVVFLQRAADFSLVTCMVQAWRYHLIVLKQKYTEQCRLLFNSVEIFFYSVRNMFTHLS
jgi:hypothetical protein